MNRSLLESKNPTIDVNIETSWKVKLQGEFGKPYFSALIGFLKAERTLGKVIYPTGKDIFKSFELTPFDQVKVVILGQDPYHNRGQAHGLSFSVPHGEAIPPSLQNIYKELKSDMGLTPPKSGDLTLWASRGVLLLNAILTVEANQAASHQGKGWEIFTDAIIRTLSDQRDGIVFIFWGKYAQSKKGLLDLRKHRCISAPHPSPFSAHTGFFGHKPFSKTNSLLLEMSKEPIDWCLSSLAY